MARYGNGHLHSAAKLEDEKNLLSEWFQGMPMQAELDSLTYARNHPAGQDELVRTALEQCYRAGFMDGGRAGVQVIQTELKRRRDMREREGGD